MVSGNGGRVERRSWQPKAESRGAMVDGRAGLGRMEGECVSVAGWS